MIYRVLVYSVKVSGRLPAAHLQLFTDVNKMKRSGHASHHLWHRLISLLIIGILIAAAHAQTCTRTGTCKCVMSDNSGEINLNSLASPTSDPRWTIDGGDRFEYSYNPCVGFSSPKFQDLSIHQVRINETNLEYDLGVQSTETFVFSLSKETSVQYTSADTRRSSSVLLVCDRNVREHRLEFVGELVTTEYDFILVGPCCCPGICDEKGVIGTSTVPSSTSTQSHSTESRKPDPASFNWNQVGIDLVSLILHDLLLVVVIATVVVIVKIVRPTQPVSRGQDMTGNGVTSAAPSSHVISNPNYDV